MCISLQLNHPCQNYNVVPKIVVSVQNILKVVFIFLASDVLPHWFLAKNCFNITGKFKILTIIFTKLCSIISHLKAKKKKFCRRRFWYLPFSLPFFCIFLERTEIRVLCLFGTIIFQLVENKHRRYIFYCSTFRLHYISLFKYVNCYCETDHC